MSHYRVASLLMLSLFCQPLTAGGGYRCVSGNHGEWQCSGDGGELRGSTSNLVEESTVSPRQTISTSGQRLVGRYNLNLPPLGRGDGGGQVPPTAEISTNTRYRFSFDEIPVSASENMGTVGVHYDLKPFGPSSDIYWGFGGYGAMTGDRGGFFVGGATLGWHKFLDLPSVDLDHAIDAGIFVGGGGGAGAFPGGGLMVRSHLMLEKGYDPISLRYGIARIDFPNSSNTNNSSTHLTLGVSIPTHQISSRWLDQGLKSDYSSRRMVPVVTRYSPDSDARKRGGESLAAEVTLIGFQHHQLLGKNLYRTFEVYGAGKGGVDGYAKVLGGLGWSYPLAGWFLLDGRLSAGMSGGGGIDTGGGLILQPMLGAEIRLSEHWSLRPMLGRSYAPNGNFSSTTMELGLSWTGGRSWSEDQSHSSSDTRYSIINKSYFPDGSARTKGGGRYAESIQQLGIMLSLPVNDWMSVSGSAYGAYRGGVGAYAEGLFGVELNPLGIWSSSESRWSPFIRYEVGVGGGGGMDVGDGFIHQHVMGMSYLLWGNVELTLEGGRMTGLDGGTFGATVFQAGIEW